MKAAISNETVEEATRILRTKGEDAVRSYLSEIGYGQGTTRHIIRVAQHSATQKRGE